MKILVTGGAGFIGSHVADHLVEEGHDVHIVDNLSSGSLANVPDKATFHHLDLRDAELTELFQKERFPNVIHHAAQLDVRRSVDDPVFDADINITGFLRLMEAGRLNGLQRVVFASTGGAIYGESSDIPQKESSGLKPESPYGITKLAAEKYLHYYERVHGIMPVILRYANVYGPRQGTYGEAGVIAIFIRKILAGEAPLVFGDGTQTRDYTFVGDVVRANRMALDAEEGGIYNIGTGIETSVNTLIDRLKPLLNADVHARHLEKRAGEVHRSVLSYDRIREAWGWEPAVDLEAGLRETVAWFNSRT